MAAFPAYGCDGCAMMIPAAADDRSGVHPAVLLPVRQFLLHGTPETEHRGDIIAPAKPYEVPLIDWRLSNRPSVFYSRVPVGGGGSSGGDRRRLPSLAIGDRVKHLRAVCLYFRGKAASVTRPRAVEQRKTDRSTGGKTIREPLVRDIKHRRRL